ncbi:MAG TPA: universal stress protein [Hyphomicrobiaceae bacterium]|nr:universal stress protein [Hyphomicrobiaceae bacterium]
MPGLLVAIDGSDCAARALDHAISLARRLNDTQLHLLNVHPDPTVYGEIQVYVPVKRMLELQRNDSEVLLAPAIEQARMAAIPCQAHIEHGDAATVIAQRASDLDCDGIIMGTRGLGAIGNLLLGSVALKVVHLTHVPVTLVK